MYNNDDIQKMIERVNNDDTRDLIMDCKCISDFDYRSIDHVLESGCAEDFERYDSDVCEQFIRAYEEVYCMPF